MIIQLSPLEIVFTLPYLLFFLLGGPVGQCAGRRGERSSDSDGCSPSDLHLLENMCNPYLGQIGTAILASDGRNFTSMCESFSLYVLCVEPRSLHCEPSRLSQYWYNKLTYMDEPYACPPVLPTVYNISQLVPDWTEQMKHYTQRTGNSGTRTGGAAQGFFFFVNGIQWLSVVGVMITWEGFKRILFNGFT